MDRSLLAVSNARRMTTISPNRIEPATMVDRVEAGSEVYSAWLKSLPETDFEELLEVADEFYRLQHALAQDGLTILTELLRDESDAPLVRWQHYPEGDVEDPVTGAMYYYHAHDPVERPEEEHGHFHLFVRPSSSSGFSHVVGLSLDALGRIRTAFTTNRWVTDECIRPADEVLAMVPEGFVIDRARPSWLLSRWLMAVPRLIWPQLVRLLRDRDAELAWSGDSPLSEDVSEDRALQVLSEEGVDLMTVLSLIQQEAISRYQP